MIFLRVFTLFLVELILLFVVCLLVLTENNSINKNAMSMVNSLVVLRKGWIMILHLCVLYVLRKCILRFLWFVFLCFLSKMNVSDVFASACA